MSASNLTDPAQAAQSANQAINWRDFRDHLSTADQAGRRRWLYPKKPVGRFYRWRTWASWLLLAIMFIGPFVRINGNPLLLINIVERRFSILGRSSGLKTRSFSPWRRSFSSRASSSSRPPSAVSGAAGPARKRCSWKWCSERSNTFIEGDAAAQRALDAAPWTFRKNRQETDQTRRVLWAFLCDREYLLSYIIGSDQLIRIVTDNPMRHLAGLGFMVLFTLVFYAIFARFESRLARSSARRAPAIDSRGRKYHGGRLRLQRGERRAHLPRGQDVNRRRTEGLGDCIDCLQCVRVCPTGIDIRDGTQMECVNCTACIDACDAIMDKVKRPRVSFVMRRSTVSSVPTF